MSSHLKESLICQSLDLLNGTFDHNKDYAGILSSYETWHVPELLKSQVLLLPMWESRSLLNVRVNLYFFIHVVSEIPWELFQRVSNVVNRKSKYT